jgi:DNA processing protein
MSGLALATVVVEASATSGAKMQARYALEHGRPVFLIQSLVEEHDWAREYVQVGRYGAKAIRVSSPAEIVERIDALETAEPLLAF